MHEQTRWRIVRDIENPSETVRKFPQPISQIQVSKLTVHMLISNTCSTDNS